jgi:signal transduction histidine kinase
MVLLSIEDNGRGMPPSVVEALGSGKRSHNVQSLGIGLVGMRERLRQLGGELEIHSSAQGTTVRAAVPLPGASYTGSDTIFNTPE